MLSFSFRPPTLGRAALLVAGLLFCGLQTPLTAQSALERTLAEAAAMANDGDLQGAAAKLEAVRLDALGESMLGKLYVELGRGEDALELLAPLADKPEANAPVIVDAARAAVQSGDPIRAGKWLNRALAIDPEGPAQREMGVLLGGLGDHREAYPLLIGWVRNNPTDSTARILAALSASELDRPFEVGQLLEGLPAEDPRVGLLRGQMLLERGDGAGAVAALQPLLADAPNEMLPKIRTALSEAYLVAEQPMAAIDLLEGNVGDDIQLALQLSRAFEDAGFEPSAASAIQRFVEPLTTRLDELPPEITENAAALALRFGVLKLKGGESEQAIEYLEIAARLTPDDPEIWRELVKAQRAAGNQERATAAQGEVDRTEQQESLAGTGDSESQLDDIATTLRLAMRLNESSPEEALDLLKYEARVAPRDPRPPLGAARVLQGAERYDEALVFVRYALDLVPVPASGPSAGGNWKVFRSRALSLQAYLLADLERPADALKSLEELQRINAEFPELGLRIQRMRERIGG